MRDIKDRACYQCSEKTEMCSSPDCVYFPNCKKCDDCCDGEKTDDEQAYDKEQCRKCVKHVDEVTQCELCNLRVCDDCSISLHHFSNIGCCCDDCAEHVSDRLAGKKISKMLNANKLQTNNLF